MCGRPAASRQTTPLDCSHWKDWRHYFVPDTETAFRLRVISKFAELRISSLVRLTDLFLIAEVCMHCACWLRKLLNCVWKTESLKAVHRSSRRGRRFQDLKEKLWWVSYLNSIEGKRKQRVFEVLLKIGKTSSAEIWIHCLLLLALIKYNGVLGACFALCQKNEKRWSVFQCCLSLYSVFSVLVMTERICGGNTGRSGCFSLAWQMK